MRVAVASGDGQRIVAVLAGVDLARCAQQIGDHLIAAIENGATEVHPLAGRCAGVLRERFWEGDEELAAQLDAALDPTDDAPALIVFRVDLDELSELLESGDRVGGFVNLETGDTWQNDMLDGIDEEDRPDFDDPDIWMMVPSFGRRFAYRDMEDFLSTVTDVHLADRLAIAIDGSGAFGRFTSVLRHTPDAEDHWYEFSNEHRFGRARAWLTRAGKQPKRRTYGAPTS